MENPPLLESLRIEIAALRQHLAALELALAENERRLFQSMETSETYRILLDESSDPIFAFFRDGTYRYVNQAFAEGVGKPQTEITGRKIWDIFSQAEADQRFAAVQWVFEHGETWVLEVRVPRAEGDRHYITTLKPVLNPAGQADSVICISKEITERKRMEEELRRLSTYDILTGLYNRNHFETELARLSSSPVQQVCVVVADLDNLKIVNDHLGHAAGDDLIRLTAQVLRESFRPTDLIARIGGDEFVVLLPETDQATLDELLAGLHSNLRTQSDSNLHLSVGTAAGRAGDSFLDLLRLADDRMYAQKKNRRLVGHSG